MYEGPTANGSANAPFPSGELPAFIISPKSEAEPEEGEWVAREPCYEVDLVLLTSKDHPLTRRHHVRPQDLGDYPLVHNWAGFSDLTVRTRIEQWHIAWTQPHRVEAVFTASIRRCVAAGLGIALVPRTPRSPPWSNLHERLMTRYFGCPIVYVVWRKGAPRSVAATGFVETVKALLNRPPGSLVRSRRRALKPSPVPGNAVPTTAIS